MKKGLIILACLFVGISCTPADGTQGNDKGNGGGQTDGLTSYLEIYDHTDDYSYFTYPQTTRVPKKHWVCTDVENRSDRNTLGLSESNRGLQYHLLAQSLAGLVNRAMDKGKVDFGLWLQSRGGIRTMQRRQILVQNSAKRVQ